MQNYQIKNKIFKTKTSPWLVVVTAVILFLGSIVFTSSALAVESTFTTSLTTTGLSTLPPSIPTNLSATAVSDTQIDLSWTASIPNFYAIGGYRIFRDSLFLATTTSTIYSDTSLIPVTPYSYTVEAFDTLLQMSGQSATSTATTTATPIPTPPPGGGGGGGGTGTTGIIISNVRIVAGTNQAQISFTTNVLTQSKVQWGFSQDFELGSLQNLFYGYEHTQVITGLSEGLTYQAKLSANNSTGASVSTNVSFTTILPITEVGPLPNPSDFEAIATDKDINLSWVNPEDPRFNDVRIVRTEGFYPIDQYDGVPIYEGDGESFVDTTAKKGVTYYYAIFSRSLDGEYSSGALAQARIAIPGEEPVTAVVDPFANLPQAKDVHPMIKALTLADFEFIQDGRNLATVVGNTVAIHGGKNLTVRLKYDKVPEILKTVAFTLEDPTDKSKVFPFLLRVNKDKTYYEATIGALGRSGRYGMSVAILDYENNGLMRLNGTLAALAFASPLFDFGKNFDFLGLLILLLFIILIILAIMLLKRWVYYSPEHEVEKRQAYSTQTTSTSNARRIIVGVFALVFTQLFIFGFSSSALAAFNPEINYQGKLVTSTNSIVPDGAYNIRFKLYTSLSGGSPIWTETWCNTSDCAGTGIGTDDRIDIVNGLFSTMLGSTTAFTGIDFNQPLYLGVEIGGSGATAVWDGEMSPRKILGAVPAAFYAGTSTVALSANTLDGLDSGQFFRNDTQNATSSSSTFMSILQSGAGKIAEFFGSASQSVLALLSNGNVGIGTSTPSSKLTLAGGNFTHIASSSPTLIGTYNTTGQTRNVFVSGKYAYVADDSPGLLIFDITNPASPALISTTNTSGGAYDVVVSGKYAYVADRGSGLQIIDVSNPYAPVIVKNFDPVLGNSLNVKISGKYVYVINDSQGLRIFDVSDPLNPVETGSYDLSGAGNHRGLFISSKYAYITDLGYGLIIVDITNPSSPSFVGSYDSSGDAYGVYVSGKYAYVVDNLDGLKIVDVSNPASPTLVGSYDTNGNAQAVFVSGKYAYISDSGTGTHVIDVSNPASPFLVGTNITASYGIFISGKYAYIASTGPGLNILDINGIETPSLYAGNIATNGLTVTENADIGNSLYVRNSLNVGLGGIFTDGVLSVAGTSSSYFGGNLGLGTTSPYARLSVVGQVVGEYFTATSTTATSTFPNLALTNLLFGSDYLTDITGTGLAISNGALSVTGAAILGAANMLAGFDASGNLVSTSSPQVEYINATSTTATSTFAGGLSVAGDSGLTVLQNGKVGIGTTTPVTAGLTIDTASNVPHINLSVNASSNILTNTNIRSRAGNILATPKYFQATGPYNLYYFDGTDINKLNAWTGGFLNDNIYATGNVGIGTTSPYAKLSVAGETVSEYFTATSTTATSTFPNLSLTNLLFGSDYLSDITGSGLTISNNALTVTGAAILGAANMLAGFDSSGNLTSTSSPQVAYINATSTTATSTFAGGLSVAGTAGLSVLQNGSVGIGTINPGSKLEVVGDIISKGTSWTARSATLNSSSWLDITHGNGLFVAIGNGGDRVMTSPDGINWTARSATGNGDSWQGITYGNGLFVAVGNSGAYVMTSPDGINWTARTAVEGNDGWFNIDEWTDITYGNGLFVAVGSGTDDRVMTSPDGINWTARSAVGNDDSWQSITYGNGLFVAVSNSGDRVMTSPDGINWTAHSAAGNNEGWLSITYGDGLFVAVSYTGDDYVMTSPDGINWTARSAAGNNDGWQGITYGNGLFVAVSNSGDRLMTSPDGINWTVRSAAGDNDGWQSITYSNGMFVAVGNSGDPVMTSGKTEQTMLAHNNLYQGGMNIFGNVGLGTTSPFATLSVTGIGSFDNYVRASYFTATSTTASTFPYASTTALTVSGTNGLQLASGLNGLLQAVNGLVQSSSTLSIAYGGTGLSTAPAYGELLLGNASGGYTLTSTSSLGIASGWDALSDISLTKGYFVVGDDAGLAQATSSLFVSSTGNIGIGTTTPTSKLALSGGNFIHTAFGNPTLEGVYNTSGSASDVYVSGKYAYVADSDSGLQIIDISNPTSPTLTGTYSTVGSAVAVYVSGKFAYIEDSTVQSNFKIVDISNPTSPTLVGEYSNTGGSISDIYVSGKYAYTADYNLGLQIIDISNPTSPTLVSSLDTIGEARGIYVSGKYAYVADNGSGLHIIDVTNPASPTLVGTYDTSGFALGIYVSGGYAYVADYTSGLQIINISNPSSPTLVGTYNTSGSASDVYVSGGYAYVADYASGLQVVDITNPASPTLVGTYNTSGFASRVYVSGKYAYVADGIPGLQIIDINGIETPSLYAGNINTNDLTVTENGDFGNNLYVRNGLNVGAGGIFTDGVLSVAGTSTSYFGGNVGIGTTSPYAKLSVVGQVVGEYFTATSTTATSTFAGVLSVGSSTPASNALFSVGTSTQNFIVDKNTGFVGIGTSSPTAPLSIDSNGIKGVYLQDSPIHSYGTNNFFQFGQIGTSYAAISSVLHNFNNNLGLLIRKVGTGTGDYLDVQDSASSTQFIIKSSGNIGIGTSSPYAKLSVVGEIVGEYFTATSTTATSTFAGGMNVAGSSGLTVLQNGRVGINKINPVANLHVYSADNTTAVFERASYGAIALSSVPNYNRIVSLTSATGSYKNLVIENSGYNSGVSMIVNTLGNVGIGTTTPYSRLSVWGLGTGTNRLFELTNSASTTLATFFEDGTGYFLGNIGIGTTSPYAKLSVVGQVVGEYFTATSTTATSTFAGGMSVAGSTGLSVLQNGMVGIGTTAPESTFHISGANPTFSFERNGFFRLGIESTGGNAEIYVEDTGASAGHLLLQRSMSGNVGIGTTTPYAKLSVVGSSALGNSALAGYFIATTTTASVFPYASTTALTVSGTSGLQLASGLNGPLQAINGLVSATSTLSIGYGGTGLSTAPAYGELLLGNASGGYTLTSTTSLGIASGWSALSDISLTKGYFVVGDDAGVAQATSSLFLSSLGYLGIGTTTPSALLHVASSSPSSSMFVVSTSTTESFIPSPAAFVVTSTGQVGIGGTPSGNNTPLSIYANTNALNAINFRNYAIGSDDKIMLDFSFNRDNGTGGSGGTDDAGYIAFGKEQAWTTSGASRDSYVDFFVGRDGSDAFGMRLSSAGNLGIGTTSPWAKLSVEGTSTLGNQAIAGYFTATSTTATSTFGGVLSVGSTTPAGNSLFSVGTSTQNLFVDKNTGRVGIGTSAPTQALDVANGGLIKSDLGYKFGTSNFAPYLFSFSGTSRSAPSASGSNIAFYTYLGSGGNEGVSFTGDTIAPATGVYDGVKFLRLFAVSSGTGVFNTFSVSPSINQTGTATGISRGIYVDPTLTSAADWRSIETTNNNGYAIYAGGTANSYFAGNVGIGSTSPYAKLSITNTGTQPSFLVEDSTSPDSSPFIIDSNGNVGIGTSTPNALLDLDLGTTKQLRFSTSPTIYSKIENSSSLGGLRMSFSDSNGYFDITQAHTYYGFLMHKGGTYGGQGLVGANNNLVISTGATTQDIVFNAVNFSSNETLRIKGTGNIGIGTSSPYAKLSVVGQVVGEYFTATSTTATSTFPNLSLTNLLFGSDYLTDLTGSGLSIISNALTVTGLSSTTLANRVASFDDAGNLTGSTTLSIVYGGTGTSSAPTYGQLLMGDGSGNYSFAATSTLGILASSAIGMGTQGFVPYYAANEQALTATSSLFISQSSFIGIGTTTPTSALSVFSASSPQFQLAYDKDNYVTTGVSSSGGVTMAVNGSAGGFAITNPQPTAVVSGTGTNAPLGFSVAGGVGGNSLDTNIGVGGIGGGIQLNAGAGGVAAFSTFSETGGSGGTVSVNGGAGGNASSPDIDFMSRVAGAGGLFSFIAGAGGNAANGGLASSNTAGAGGIFTLKGGAGGNASGATTNNGGAGGSMYLSGGAGGTGSTANGTAGNLYLGYDGSNPIGNVYFGNQSASYIGSTGNFGIGTSSPYAKLSVVGEAVAEYFTATSTTATSTFAGGLRAGDASGLFVQQNGNVGIGAEANATNALKVSGTTLITANSSDVLAVTGTGTGGNILKIYSNFGWMQTGFGSPSGSLGYLRTTSNGTTPMDFGIKIGDTEMFRIATTSNVGIGTSTPYAKLSVAGASLGTTPIFAVSTSTASATSTAFIVDANGNVGIGSSTPMGIFGIQTSSSANKGFYFNASNQFVLPLGGTATLPSLAFISGGTISGLSSTNAASVDFTLNGTNVLQFGRPGSSNARISNKNATGDIQIWSGNESNSAGQLYLGSSGVKSYLSTNSTFTVGSSTPYAKLAVYGNAGETNSMLFAVASSTDSATTTHFVVKNDGKVGIGTSNPSYKLQIASGSIYQNGTADSNYFDAHIFFGGTAPTYQSVLRADGKIGLGTTTPYAKLSVVGQTVSEYFTATSTMIASTFPYASTTALTVSGSTYLSGLSSGGVGVGTDGLLYSYSTSTWSFASSTLLSDNNTFSGTNTFGALSASSLNLGSSLANMLAGFDASGNLTSTSSPQVAYINATSTTATSSFAGGLSVAGTAGLGVLQNGNVGIGTASPSTKLNVLGTTEQLRLSYDATNYNSFTTSNTGILSIGMDGTNNLKIGNDPSYAGYSNLWAGGIGSPSSTNYGWQMKNDGTEDWFNVASGGFMAFTVNNAQTLPLLVKGTSVGVGYLSSATLPNLLSVNGKASFVNNVAVGTTSTYARLSVWGAGTGTNRIFELANSASTTLASFLEDGTGYFAGNIGIGTTTPWAKLSVEGTSTLGNQAIAGYFTATSTTATSTFAGGLDVGSGNFVYDLDTGITSISSLETGNMNFEADAGIVSWTDLPVVSALSGTPESYTAQVGGQKVLTVYGESDGAGSARNLRVGIGTSSPWATLSVSGSTTLATSNAFVVSDVASTTRFVIQDAGNVGIGTTSPFALLSVAGIGSFDDYVRASYFTAASTTATSTFAGGVEANLLNITSTTATSTFANGIQLTGGCFRMPDGSCAGTGAGGGWNSLDDIVLTKGYTIVGDDAGLGQATSSLFMSSTGNIGVGSTTPFAKLSVHANWGENNTSLFEISSSTASATTSLFKVKYDGKVIIGTEIGGITDSLYVTGGIRTQSSFTGPINTTGSGLGVSNFSVTNGASPTRVTLASSTLTGAPGTSARTVFGGSTATTLTAGDNYSSILVGNYGPTEAVSGDHPLLAQLSIKGLFANPGVATVSNTASLYIEDSASTTVVSGNNYSLWVDNGISRFDGNVGIGTSSPYAQLSIAGGAGQTTDLFAISSSTASFATTTAFKVDSDGTVSAHTILPWGDGKQNLGALTSRYQGIYTQTIYGGGNTLSLIAGTGGNNMRFCANNCAAGAGQMWLMSAGGGGLTIGTSTAVSYAKLQVRGNGATSATQTIEIYNTASTTLMRMLDDGTTYFGGNVGIGTTSPYAKLSIVGEAVARNFTATSTTATSTFAGGLDVGSGNLVYDLDTGITSINSLSTGNMNFEEDAGAVSWVDLPITNAPAGTVESYTAHLGGRGVLSVYGLTDAVGRIATTSVTVAIGTSTPYTSGLTIWGPDTLASTRVLDVLNSASSSLLTVYGDGAVKIGGTTSTTTINGYLDVIGTGTNSTSTISSNLWVKGTLRSNFSYVGDLVFANNFTFTEALPINSTTTQALYLNNQKGERVLAIDDMGNLKITGDICSDNVTCVNESLSKLSSDLDALASSTANIQAGMSGLSDGIAQTTTSSVQSLADAIVALNLRVDALVASSTIDVNFLIASTSMALASSTEFIASVSTSTATVLNSDTGFITSIANAVKNILSSAQDWAVDKFTAKVAYVNRVEAETVAISKGMEIVDQASGAVWCVTIKNGDWDKVMGTCASLASTTPVVTPTPSPVASPTPIVIPATTISPEPEIASTTTSTTATSTATTTVPSTGGSSVGSSTPAVVESSPSPSVSPVASPVASPVVGPETSPASSPAPAPEVSPESSPATSTAPEPVSSPVTEPAPVVESAPAPVEAPVEATP